VLGPAVLFWSMVLVMGVLAWGLARMRWTPLGAAAWFLLGIGLAQASLASAAVVVGWFVVLAARQRFGATLPRVRFNLMQVILVLWTLAAAVALFGAIHSGLLGYPDMLIEGNGSNGSRLIWYQDRLSGDLPHAWVISVPLYFYRALMLAWALWLARSVIQWARWAWGAYSADGYWKARPPGEKSRLSRRAVRSQPPKGEGDDDAPDSRST
jgi:hypothetical protein